MTINTAELTEAVDTECADEPTAACNHPPSALDFLPPAGILARLPDVSGWSDLTRSSRHAFRKGAIRILDWLMRFEGDGWQARWEGQRKRHRFDRSAGRPGSTSSVNELNRARRGSSIPALPAGVPAELRLLPQLPGLPVQRLRPAQPQPGYVRPAHRLGHTLGMPTNRSSMESERWSGSCCTPVPPSMRSLRTTSSIA